MIWVAFERQFAARLFYAETHFRSESFIPIPKYGALRDDADANYYGALRDDADANCSIVFSALIVDVLEAALALFFSGFGHGSLQFDIALACCMRHYEVRYTEDVMISAHTHTDDIRTHSYSQIEIRGRIHTHTKCRRLVHTIRRCCRWCQDARGLVHQSTRVSIRVSQLRQP